VFGAEIGNFVEALDEEFESGVGGCGHSIVKGEREGRKGSSYPYYVRNARLYGANAVKLVSQLRGVGGFSPDRLDISGGMGIIPTIGSLKRVPSEK
jgi:hypothetical protein